MESGGVVGATLPLLAYGPPLPCGVANFPLLGAVVDPVAFSTRGWSVPEHRWIANLSDGSMVFEDNRHGQPSAWRRLAQYVNENNLLITGLRLQAYGKTVNALPYRDKSGTPQISGYWQAKRQKSILPIGGGHIPQQQDHGIGYVLNGNVHVVWLCQDGTVQSEVRSVTEKEMGCILNHGEES